jgi:hypothetical protein
MKNLFIINSDIDSQYRLESTLRLLETVQCKRKDGYDIMTIASGLDYDARQWRRACEYIECNTDTSQQEYQNAVETLSKPTINIEYYGTYAREDVSHDIIAYVNMSMLLKASKMDILKACIHLEQMLKDVIKKELDI